MGQETRQRRFDRGLGQLIQENFPRHDPGRVHDAVIRSLARGTPENAMMIVVLAFHHLEHLTNIDVVEVDDEAIAATRPGGAVDEPPVDERLQNLREVVDRGANRLGNRRTVEKAPFVQHGEGAHAEIGPSG